MKFLRKNILFLLLAGLAFVLPTVVRADDVQSGLGFLRTLFPYGSNSPAGSTSVTMLISNIIRILLLFAGAIAVLFVIIGGFQYMTSAGNDEQAEKGRKTATNAVIGIVIIILSYVIVSVVTRLVTSGGTYF